VTAGEWVAAGIAMVVVLGVVALGAVVVWVMFAARSVVREMRAEGDPQDGLGP